MINFEAIEYFLTKKKYILKKELHKKLVKSSPTQYRPLQKFSNVSKGNAYITNKKIATPPPSKPVNIQKKISPSTKRVDVNQQAPIQQNKNAPASEKKDHFYEEWKNKYKKMNAESLLTNTPFRRHALFIVDKNSPKEFTNKIFQAINSRLMDATFATDDKPLEELIKLHTPTHVIASSSITKSLPLPGLLIDNLSEIEKDNEKKKQLWNSLKERLKE